MKNAMKKLMSLLLVAMLLVSVCPVQAFATEGDGSAETTEATEAATEATTEATESSDFSDEVAYGTGDDDDDDSATNTLTISVTYTGKDKDATYNTVQKVYYVGTSTKSDTVAQILTSSYEELSGIATSKLGNYVKVSYSATERDGDTSSSKKLTDLGTYYKVTDSDNAYESVEITAEWIPQKGNVYFKLMCDVVDEKGTVTSQNEITMSSYTPKTAGTLSFSEIQSFVGSGYTVKQFEVTKGDAKEPFYNNNSKFFYGESPYDADVTLDVNVKMTENKSGSGSSGSSSSSSSGSSSGSSNGSGASSGDSATSTDTTADTNVYNGGYENKNNKNHNNKIVLQVYKKSNLAEPAKTIDITDDEAEDGKVSLKEIKSEVRKYFAAKNSDGILYDGLYMHGVDWVDEYNGDYNKYTSVEGLLNEVQYHDVKINVVIDNANVRTSSSSSSSSSSNPKTGDEIMMAVTVMGLSVSALAVMYYLNKKRAI